MAATLAGVMKLPGLTLCQELFQASGEEARHLLTGCSRQVLEAFDPETGQNPILACAQLGFIHLLPQNTLTTENIMLKNDVESTVLHYANLDQIPIHLLTQESMSVRNNNGRTPMHVAAIRKQLGLVPTSLLTIANLTEQDHQQYTPLMLAGAGLRNIPKEVFTEKTVLGQNIYNNNLLHEAARNKCLDLIPIKLLTIANLTKQDRIGKTPLEYAAEANYLEQIPILLPEYLRTLTDDNRLAWDKALTGLSLKSERLAELLKIKWEGMQPSGDWSAL